MLDNAHSRKHRAPSPERGAGRIARNRMRIAWMYYVEGLTQNEIADRLGIGRVTVVRNINEAIKQREVKIWIEGEVGFVGYAGGRQSRATSPEEAARFAAETGIDALAISIGNVHLQQEKTDGIDFDALRAIEAATAVPLVLHGASGIAPAIRGRLAHDHRVRKFNIGTELRQAFGAALRKSLADQPSSFDRIELLRPTIAAVREAARDAITSIGPGRPIA